MLKRAKALLIAVMVLTIGVCSFSFESKASEAFYVDYNEPTSNENSGYINILARSKITGVKLLHTFYWTIEPYTQLDASSLSATHMSINLTNNGTVTFNAYCSGSVKADVTIMFYDGNGNAESNYINDTISSGEIFRTYSLNSSSLYYYEGYQVFGNYGNITSDFASSFFTVVYGDTKKEIEEQEESNTWLEKIFDLIKGSSEQEKQEAQTQGNQSTSDATTAITDNSQGFIDSLGGLASSMSYSGTNCSWTFPAITLPAIPGVMDSVQLTSEQPIDFTYWVNQIPANLLLLIQSLLTIALIIYCFKEVYGTISYVLTLRGGGSE